MKNSWVVYASFLSLSFFACSAPESPVLTPPSLSPSLVKSPSVTASPSPSLVKSPSATASPSPSPVNSPSATPSPNVSQTLSPVPEYSNDCSKIEKPTIVQSTQLKGEIINNEGAGVFATVQLRSLDACKPYTVKTLTDRSGKYSFPYVPYGQALEIEVFTSNRASAFYQTKLIPNPDKKPEINYFPFRVQKESSYECLAIVNRKVDVSGKIDVDSLGLPPNSEASLHLRSLDGCSGFDETMETKKLAYSFNAINSGASGHLTISFNGRPTVVKQIGVSTNYQNLPNVNIHNLIIDSFPINLKKLDPVWILGAAYPRIS